jgi:hypothetical protein
MSLFYSPSTSTGSASDVDSMVEGAANFSAYLCFDEVPPPSTPEQMVQPFENSHQAALYTLYCSMLLKIHRDVKSGRTSELNLDKFPQIANGENPVEFLDRFSMFVTKTLMHTINPSVEVVCMGPYFDKVVPIRTIPLYNFFNLTYTSVSPPMRPVPIPSQTLSQATNDILNRPRTPLSIPVPPANWTDPLVTPKSWTPSIPPPPCHPPPPVHPPPPPVAKVAPKTPPVLKPQMVAPKQPPVLKPLVLKPRVKKYIKVPDQEPPKPPNVTHWRRPIQWTSMFERSRTPTLDLDSFSEYPILQCS